MKKPNPLRQILFALAFVFALTAFIPAAHQVDAQAKTYKISANPKWQKAPVMKKTGTYAVTAKKMILTFHLSHQKTELTNLPSVRSKLLDQMKKILATGIREQPAATAAVIFPL